MPDVKFSNQYPYTDFHELNLDWVIKEVKYWSTKVGKTIQSITLTGTVGLVDTYTITYSDGTTSTFDVTNGNGITSVAKTGTAGLVDTYTIAYSDGSTSTFYVTNGNGIVSVAKTGTAGLVDTYTITLTDGSMSTFEVNNGTASIDDTLTKTGWAADAKVTGENFAIVSASSLLDVKFFVHGYISNSGYYQDDSTNGAITTLTLKMPTVFNIPATMQYNIVRYSDGVFVDRMGWTAGTGNNVTVTEDEYKIIFSSINTVGAYTINDTMSQITYFSTEAQYMINHIASTIDAVKYINKIGCTWTANKICHYSVDDTWDILKDLTTNAAAYTSIFDNATLSAIKTIHESTGLCVTFNTFNTVSSDNTYSITNVPEKASFQAEFQANKNWLRFAFHAEDDNTNYDTDAGILTSYNTFVTAIYKLTGDYGCIDTFTRLGYFGGSLANVLQIKNASHGIRGLLCADTTNRDSYYLDTNQNTIVQHKGMCVDAENELIFLKTITRTLSQAPAEIEENLCYQKYVEVFSHEYEPAWITSCNTIATWLKNNGFVFAFPSDIFNIE